MPCWRLRVRMIMLVAMTALAVIGPGCDRPSGARPATPSVPVAGPEQRFPIKLGDRTVSVRLAIHEREREQGLMNVTSMAEDEGMLFIWARPQRMSFYMRNTRVPLDIGYFDSAGVLREIHPMYPGVEDAVVSRASSLQFALELNQGWYRRHDVTPGAVLDLATVSAALRARGYDPGRFLAVP